MKFSFETRRKSFSSDSKTALSDAVCFIEQTLKDFGSDKRLIRKAVLSSEESAAMLIENAEPGAFLKVKIKGLLGDAEIVITMQGREINRYAGKPIRSDKLQEMEDEDAQRAISAIILNAERDRISFSYTGGENRVRILVGEASRFLFQMTVASLILGIAFGLLMGHVFPETFTDVLSSYLLEPISTMFMSALKIVIAPVIFFSIVSCISQFESIRDLGKIGVRVIGMYVLTAVIACTIAWGIFNLFHPGIPGFALSMEQVEISEEYMVDVDTSILSILIGVVPTNFLKPFVESNSLQIIFLAVLVGIAIGIISEHSRIIKGFFDGCNELAMTVTTLIMRFIPVAVFCAMALMMADLGGQSIVSVVGMALTHTLTVVCMIGVYGLLILLFTRLNPITFFRKNREGMLTSMTLRSSSAAMPINMNICTGKLGISQKICSFSIPLGATLYMDGFCIYLVTACLFLARACGVSVPVSAIPALFITSILLSLGAPGVPGSGLICLGVLLGSLGIPITAIGIVMGIDPFLDMFITVANTTGNVASSLIVGKRANLVDIEIYNDKLV